MSRRVLFLQHEPVAGPDLLGEAAEGEGLEVVVVDVPAVGELPDPGEFALVVPLGSVASAYDSGVPWIPGEAELLRRADSAGVPILGVCFGAQLLAHTFGGRAIRGSEPEIGWRGITSDAHWLVPPGPWMQWHYDTFELPSDADVIARNAHGPQAFLLGPHLGVQFHPEVTPGSIAKWVDYAADMLTAEGIDGSHLVAESERHHAANRSRAHSLFSAFRARSR